MAKSTVQGGEKWDLRRVHRHLEHPSNAVRVQRVAMPISLFVEEQGRPVGCTGRVQHDVIAKTVPNKYAKPAQTAGVTKHWSRSFLLPLPGSPEILLVSVVKANQGSKNEGERGLEWTVVGWSCSENDEEVTVNRMMTPATTLSMKWGGWKGHNRG